MSERVFGQIYGEIEAIKRALGQTNESTAYQHTGDGVPAHTASEGVLYWDYTNDDLYVNSDGASAWQLIGGSSGSSSHQLLSSTHTDTTAAAVTRGALIIGHDPSPTWKRVDHPGGINYYLRSNASDPDWTSDLTLEEEAIVGISGDVRVKFSALSNPGSTRRATRYSRT